MLAADRAGSKNVLVYIQKDWDLPDLRRQTPEELLRWGAVTFTLEAPPVCDLVVILNRLTHDVGITCAPENIWAVMQEPYVPGVGDWMVEGHEQFARVFTHHIPVPSEKYIVSQPCVPWHVNKSYAELTAMPVAEKSREVSCVVSARNWLPGHKRRAVFAHELAAAAPFELHRFGRGVRYIEDKWDGLAPYRYSIAVENSSSPDYWTEKIADCFLAYTMPVYYGCRNIDAYFPRESYIYLEDLNVQRAIDVISGAIASKLWEKNIDAIVEARRRVLEKYQFFPWIAHKITTYHKTGLQPQQLLLKKYSCSLRSRGRNIWRRISAQLLDQA